MPQFHAQVTEIETIAGHLRVRCAVAEGAAAGSGQFYLAQAAVPAHPFLRLPVFPVSAPAGGIEFWIEAAHPYAALEPEGTLDLLGPLGRGISWPNRAACLLLVAQALTRCWPLMAWALEQGWSVTWLFPEGVPQELLNCLPPTVEVRHGPPTADLAQWADVAVLDLPDPVAFARDLRALCPLRAAGFVQAFRLPLLPCGFGGCQACWVETAHGRRLACVDGPVLEV